MSLISEEDFSRLSQTAAVLHNTESSLHDLHEDNSDFYIQHKSHILKVAVFWWLLCALVSSNACHGSDINGIPSYWTTALPISKSWTKNKNIDIV